MVEINHLTTNGDRSHEHSNHDDCYIHYNGHYFSTNQSFLPGIISPYNQVLLPRETNQYTGFNGIYYLVNTEGQCRLYLSM